MSINSLKQLPTELSDDSLVSVEESTSEGIKPDTLESYEMPSDIEELEVEGPKQVLDDEWMDIIGSGDLKKKIIVPGIVESRPVKGDTVSIQLLVRLSDGTPVQDMQNMCFTLGDSEVIQGLELVVPLMDVGEKSEVYIAARFAYGSKGDGDLVPADSPLLCTISLFDFKPEVSPESLSVTDRQAIGNRKRVRGNWWFSRADYTEAVQCYKAAVDFLDDTDDVTFENDISPEVRLLLEERLKALNNMAAAQIKLCAYDAALASLSTILQCQPDNVKALFREAKALQHTGKLENARASLSKALLVEPHNKTLQQELSKLSQLMKEEDMNEKSLYRRMLGVKAPSSEKKDSRYDTIELAPFKSFFKCFVCITFAMLIYQYREMIWTTLTH